MKASLADALSRTQVDVTVAERDLAAVQAAGLSTALVTSTQIRLDALRIELEEIQKVDNTVPVMTHASADKERLRLMAAKAAWTERRETRREKTGNQLATANIAIDQAAAALDLQKNALETAAQEYKKLWETRDAEIAAGYDEKIAKVAALCDNVPLPSISMQDDEVIKDLRDALAVAQKQLNDQQIAMNSANERFKEMEAKLAKIPFEIEMEPVAALADDTAADIANAEAFAHPPPAMAEKEKTARLQRAADMVTVVSDGSKGIGKGDENQSSPNPGLNY
jgi:DNA repair exonuclease SbcCD ATPase subunit